MKAQKSFYILDSDPQAVALLTRLLGEGGHRVSLPEAGVPVLDQLVAARPDCVLLDLMLPDIDGLALTRQIRQTPELAGLRVVVVSAKAYEADRRKAREAGADGYILKPLHPDPFLRQLEALVEDKGELRYWGVHGTLPVPGPRTLRYGGNTPCVSLEFGGEGLLIFDAGSGIKELSNYLMRRNRRHTGRILISHPHWDHINGLPFFAPLYVQGNEFVIHGVAQGHLDMRALISAQMAPPYFPVTTREFGANVYFSNMREETCALHGATLRTILLTHPGNCLGFQVELAAGTVSYITDNELYPPHLPQHDPHQVAKLTAFLTGSSVLIHDATYEDSIYEKRIDWGHSAVSQTAELAHNAGVKVLHLFHHDPDQNDEDIDRKLEQAQKTLARLGSSTRVEAPAEGDAYFLRDGVLAKEA